MKHRAFERAAIIAGLFLGAALPSSASATQTPAGVEEARAFEADFAALFARFQIAQDEHQARLHVLYAGYDETTMSAEAIAAIQKQRAELDLRDPAPQFLREFASLAERAKGTEVAAKALLQVLSLDRTSHRSGESAGRKALATLLTVHLRSPALAELPGIVQYAPSIDFEQRADAYRKLASDGANDAIRADALHYYAIGLTGPASMGGDKPAARAAFAELKRRFGTLPSRHGKTYAAIADGFLFELDRLQLGMLAPDFAAIDEQGVQFRLSDYAGKVVVVDFWGDW